MSGRVGKPTGLSSPTEPCSTVSALSGFDPSRWNDLAATIESSAWADPVLAREIANALEPIKGHRIRHDWNPLAFLDDAITLVPHGRRRIEFGCYDGGRAWAYVHTPSGVVGECDNAPGEAAAITAAALRALASAIEARSDETHSGSAEGESAGPKDDAHA